MEMIRDGVLYIEGGQRPDFIENDLMNYLPQAQKTMYESLKFEGGGQVLLKQHKLGINRKISWVS